MVRFKIYHGFNVYNYYVRMYAFREFEISWHEVKKCILNSKSSSGILKSLDFKLKQVCN